MKGTIDGNLPEAEQQLLSSPKEKAEHATIVDLIRNDLSMVASARHGGALPLHQSCQYLPWPLVANKFGD